MAALGTIGVRTANPLPTRIPITDYNVERGNALGVIGVRVVPDSPVRVGGLTGYIVRQTRILYRQLWPTHGQRFPQ